MSRGRLEAFTDGVIAIIITIMVLELHTPRGSALMALRPLLPVFSCYALSFVYVAIYWNNHHHMFHMVRTVDGRIMWANMHLLFWLSLVPFVTAWMGENGGTWPAALYGFVLLMDAFAYTILQKAIVAHDRGRSPLARAVGNDLKGKISLVFYILGISSSFLRPWIADAFYILVALIWVVPDRRIETVIGES